jgi:phosphoribosylformylglycinamidine cyclo-ligase
VAEGDVILALASDGVHSNGFSLVRAIAAAAGLDWDSPSPFGPGPLGAALLAPTRLYVRPALAAIRAGGVHGIAHITGGGLTENVPRILPAGLAARIDLGRWTLPPVFRWLAAGGGLGEGELLKTFNAGIGLVLVVAPGRAEAIAALMEGMGERVIALGEVVAGQGVIYDGAIL